VLLPLDTSEVVVAPSAVTRCTQTDTVSVKTEALELSLVDVERRPFQFTHKVRPANLLFDTVARIVGVIRQIDQPLKFAVQFEQDGGKYIRGQFLTKDEILSNNAEVLKQYAVDNMFSYLLVRPGIFLYLYIK
jgi:hypothetical protein